MPTDTENVCLSGKTGSDRRTVKSTRLPESDIAVRKSVRQRREAEGALEAFGECVTVRGGQRQAEPRHTIDFR
jgi:hypothetical protein